MDNFNHILSELIKHLENVPYENGDLSDVGNEIGIVTSGTQSPSLQKAIGMGYIDVAFAKENSDVYILIRDQKIKAKVVKYPFYKG